MHKWKHFPIKRTWKCLNMVVTKKDENSFICSIWFRGKSIYTQKCFGTKRSALQKITRARDYLAKVCTRSIEGSTEEDE